MTQFSIDTMQSALILGLGDIGLGLVHEIRERNPGCRIFATVRGSSPSKEVPQGVKIIEHDPLDIDSWERLTAVLKESTDRLDLILSTWGFLHDDVVKPEKSLRDIDIEHMQKSFSLNAFTAPLAAKYLNVFLDQKQPNVFCFLSAKVGSISDNRMGGWYSYRASKAALNMFLKSISIELQRKKKATSVMAIHPGTTQTRLSSPFLKGFNLKVWHPRESAAHICDVLEKSYSEGTGLFKNWNHETLPW